MDKFLVLYTVRTNNQLICKSNKFARKNFLQAIDKKIIRDIGMHSLSSMLLVVRLVDRVIITTL